MRKFLISVPVSAMIGKQGKNFTTAKIFKKVCKTLQALTLGLWVQWPGGPVDLKTDWPPKKLTGPGGQ